MKKQTFAFALMLLVSAGLSAQSTSAEKARTGGMAGLQIDFSRAAGRPGIGSEFQGALVFNKLYVGTFLGVNFHFAAPSRPEEQDLTLGSIGLLFGYSPAPGKAVHFLGTLKLGGGMAILTDPANSDPTGANGSITGFWLATPSAGVEFNLTTWIRLAATAGVRLTGGYERLPGLDRGDLISPVIGLTFKMGKF